MIYVVMAAVLGLAAWQLIAFARRAKKGQCASGCSGCAVKGYCSQKAEKK